MFVQQVHSVKEIHLNMDTEKSHDSCKYSLRQNEKKKEKKNKVKCAAF